MPTYLDMMPLGSTPPRPDGRTPPPAVPPRRDLTTTARRQPRDGVFVTVVSIGVVSALVAAAILVAAPRPAPVPPQAAGASPTAPAAEEASFGFLGTTYRDGVRVPVRWNPCQPIEYQLHLIDAPRGARGAIAAAIDRTSEATGIAFVADGDTSRTARGLWADAYFADAVHSVYRPVLITVVSHDTFRSLGAPARAVAFAHPQQGTRSLDDQYVAGIVVVDGDVAYPHAGRWSLPLVVEHELGHLVGLAHVRDPSELMFSFEVAPSTIPDPIEGWGDGDLHGLEQVGADQGCLEQVRVAG